MGEARIVPPMYYCIERRSWPRAQTRWNESRVGAMKDRCDVVRITMKQGYSSTLHLICFDQFDCLSLRFFRCEAKRYAPLEPLYSQVPHGKLGCESHFGFRKSSLRCADIESKQRYQYLPHEEYAFWFNLIRKPEVRRPRCGWLVLQAYQVRARAWNRTKRGNEV